MIALHLDLEDRLQVITFANKVNTLVSLEYMTDSRKQVVLSMIRELKSYGLSNLTSGLISAIHAANQLMGCTDSREISLFIFTDGNMNAGIVDVPLMMERIKRAFESSKKKEVEIDFSCFIFGIGEDADMELLQMIALSNSSVNKISKFEHFGIFFKPLLAKLCKEKRFTSVEMMVDASASTGILNQHCEVCSTILSEPATLLFPNFWFKKDANCLDKSLVISHEDMCELEWRDCVFLFKLGPNFDPSKKNIIVVRATCFDKRSSQSFLIEKKINVSKCLSESTASCIFSDHFERLEKICAFITVNKAINSVPTSKLLQFLANEVAVPCVDPMAFQIQEDFKHAADQLLEQANRSEEFMESSALVALY